MMYELFGGDGWDSWRAMAYEHTLDNYGMGRSITDYILLPFRLFGTMDMIRYFQGSIGIGWLLMIGISLLQYKKTPTKWMWGLLLGWFTFWALQVQQVRFFYQYFHSSRYCIPTIAKWKPRVLEYLDLPLSTVGDTSFTKSRDQSTRTRVLERSTNPESIKAKSLFFWIIDFRKIILCIHISIRSTQKRYGWSGCVDITII